MTGAVLRCGALAGLLFLTTALAEGAARPDDHPARHPVSSLALASRGSVQVANLSLTGIPYLAGATGLSRTPDAAARNRVGPLLIGGAAIGLLGSGAFVTDPVSGYPPGAVDAVSERSTTGVVHDLFSVPTFLGKPAAAAVFAGGFLRSGHRSWALYSTGSSAVMPVAFGLASAASGQAPALVRFGGRFAAHRCRHRVRVADRVDRACHPWPAPLAVTTRAGS